MPIICRLLAQPASRAADLPTRPDGLADAVASAKIYNGVYRYWHGIGFLLARHSPGSLAGRWLDLGDPITCLL